MSNLAEQKIFAIVTAEFTRPNDTTTYAISDVVGPTTTAAVQTLSGVARVPGGTGYITNARLVKSGAVVTLAQFRAYFYKTAPIPIADNSPWTLLYANRAIRLGHVDFSLETEGTGSDSASNLQANLNIAFECADGAADIYAVIVAKAAYVPAANEKFFLEIKVDRN